MAEMRIRIVGIVPDMAQVAYNDEANTLRVRCNAPGVNVVAISVLANEDCTIRFDGLQHILMAMEEQTLLTRGGNFDETWTLDDGLDPSIILRFTIRNNGVPVSHQTDHIDLGG